MWPTCVFTALVRYERFLRQRGRPLYVPYPNCPCCDPIDARDTLELILMTLPPISRADLRRIVSRLDADLRRRTLPDPDAQFDDDRPGSEWQAAHWWRRRLHEPWPGR